MAKQKVEEAIPGVLATVTENSGLANRPDFIKRGDDRGTDHIAKADVQLPRIVLAQKTSKEIEEEEVKYIEDLKVGMMFNSLTQQIYGKGPLRFCILRADEPRGIEFTPIDEGGGVVDMNVPRDDPRMQFNDGRKPTATLFYDFIIQILPGVDTGEFAGHVVTLSFKSTGLKVARSMNTFMRLLEAPCFAGDYELHAAMDKNKFGTFAVFQVKCLEFCQSEEEYRRREKLFETWKEKTVNIDHGANVESEEVGDIPF